jgi:hypothetical protein
MRASVFLVNEALTGAGRIAGIGVEYAGKASLIANAVL